MFDIQLGVCRCDPGFYGEDCSKGNALTICSVDIIFNIVKRNYILKTQKELHIFKGIQLVFSIVSKISTGIRMINSPCWLKEDLIGSAFKLQTYTHIDK